METLVDYTLSTFPNASFNANVLADRIAAATAVGRRLSFVTLTGTTVSLAFPGPVVGAAKTALDAVVAAHLGQQYGPSTQSAQAMGQQSNDTTSDVAAVSLPLLPLQAGPYLFTWICELAPTSNVANTGARAALQSNLSGSFADHFEQNMSAPAVSGTFWSVFTGSVIATISQASTPTLRLVWRRMGASSNPALIRRARIALTPAS